MKLPSNRTVIVVELLVILFLISAWFIHIIPFTSTLYALVFVMISISSLLFGAIHYYQGLSGMISTGISGLFFGAYFLASGCNLWAAVLAHGVSNSIGFLLIFLGRYPGA
jgi:hypothetical protein